MQYRARLQLAHMSICPKQRGSHTEKVLARGGCSLLQLPASSFDAPGYATQYGLDHSWRLSSGKAKVDGLCDYVTHSCLQVPNAATLRAIGRGSRARVRVRAGGTGRSRHFWHLFRVSTCVLHGQLAGKQTLLRSAASSGENTLFWLDPVQENSPNKR